MNRDRTSSFGGDVAKLVGGTGLAQAIGLVFAPVLTRMYPPEAWGVATAFASLIGILTVVACFRYELAIMLPETSAESANVFGLSLLATTLTTCVCALVLLVARHRVAGLLGAPDLALYLWLVPPAVFLAGVFQAMNSWNARGRQFGRLAVSRTLQAVITNGGQLWLATLGVIHAGGLIWTLVLGSLVATLVLLAQIFRDDWRLFRASVNLGDVLAQARRYRKFPLLDTGGSLLNVVSQLSPVFLLGIYFSPAIVGQYALATRLIYLPMALIGGAISQVFFQRAAEAQAKGGDLGRLANKAFQHLSALALLPSLLFSLVGQPVFVLMFGGQWAAAGRYVEILGIWMFFQFVGAPLTSIFLVRQRLELAWVLHVLLLASRVVPLMIGGIKGNSMLAIGLFSVTGIIAYSAIAMWSLAMAGAAWRPAFRGLGRVVIQALPAAAAVLILKMAIEAPAWLLMAVSAVALLHHGWRLLRENGGLAGSLGLAVEP